MSWIDKLLREASELAVKIGGKRGTRTAETDALIAARRAAQTKRPKPQDIRANPRPEGESLAVERKKRRDTGTVNIGLKPSEKVGGPNISRQQATRALRATGRKPRNLRVLQSASEPTLVADIQPPLSAAELHDLSSLLRQDAIAQQTLPEGGLLEGPRANAWGGEFNPAFFYLQGGDTLGSSLLTDKFRAGATRQDLTALADKWGAQIDPASLAVNLGLRDEALAAGRQLPADLGVFTSSPVTRDPEALAAYLAGRPANLEGLQMQLMTEPAALSAVDARGVHISRQPGLSSLDPSFYGRGHQGEEYRAVKQLGLPKRSYFYSGPEGTVMPEPAVMGVAGEKMVRGPRYAYEANLSGLYDIDQDPEKLWALAQAYGQPLEMERWVKDRGYKGYLTDQGPSWDRKSRRAAAVYGPTEVRPISDEPIDDWRRRFAVGGRV